MINSEVKVNQMPKEYHYPVMYREVLDLLELAGKRVIVDCTTGVGSLAYKMIEKADNEAFFIGIDKDKNSLDIASRKLEEFKGRFVLIQEDFSNLDKVMSSLNCKGADAFLFDLGISTYQLNNSQRGFSFLKEGPLDMRMDKDSFLSAYDLVNNLSEMELVNIFKKFGEERYSRRIARVLVEERKNAPISTTTQLARIIMSSVPAKSHYARIHPATRIFQSLRIAVNRELESLKDGLDKAINLLNPGARLGVISFHSLEDRIVKHTFRENSLKGAIRIVTKKPLVPSEEEKQENNASRSAKLRVVEKK
ncbi:MAG: 16S rRNA (cytosine(1402)-N(4))-methyltransferase RsmH [Candidatus Omnitrophica bacterium]|nr:16S rRNA (cytosine(1402)-N(4))-methyltransferase RsmH [Candidatus Omnitrophota bacterium]MDD5429390.1 16S rRNA (cytosine(1402)-N(4))-methyltransferase RsmH [Candidatus Omnitrophota bacterium]